MPHQMMIADADAQLRRDLTKYFSSTLGYRVVAVANGRQAIDAAMENNFDLAILNIGIGGGAESLTRLRALQPGMEMIFLREQDNDEDWMRDFLRFTIPAERVLVKPLSDLSALTRLIIGILGPPVA